MTLKDLVKWCDELPKNARLVLVFPDGKGGMINYDLSALNLGYAWPQNEIVMVVEEGDLHEP